MEIELRVRERRLAFEQAADSVFEAAWAGVQTLAQPFKFDTDAWREPGGGWRDYFAATPWRPLDLPIWLLEDLGLADDGRRADIELALLTASALAATSVLSSEAVLGSECVFTIEHSLLTNGLLMQSLAAFAGTGLDPAWLHGQALRHWNQHASAMLEQRSRRVQRCADYTPDDVARLGRRWAPVKTAVYAAARVAGRSELCATLSPLLDEAAALFQLGRELGSINRDLARGHCSLPVALLLQALGGKLPEDGPPDASQALLAAVLSSTLPDLALAARERARRLQQATAQLGLHNLGRGTAALAQPFETFIALHERQGMPPAQQAASFSLSHRPQLQQVIQAASGFLRSDPTGHEAWECYRWGYLDQPELICTVFPLGVVLEHRIAAGDDCGAEVDALFAQYARNDFHYFNQPTIQPPDFDTLGLMLRLAPHGADPQRCRALLETPLAWLAANLEADGGIPVFMTRGHAEGRALDYIPVLGRRCAAVQAGVLLGLLGLKEARFNALLMRSSAQLFTWFAHSGAGAIRFYDLPYGCAQMLALADGLGTTPWWPDLRPTAEAARRTAIALMTARRGQGRFCALDAALLLLASGCEGGHALHDGTSAELLLRAQRQDGGWEAAPIYCGPTRGNLMNWHASRLITTAIARHALSNLLSPRDLQPAPHQRHAPPHHAQPQ